MVEHTVSDYFYVSTEFLIKKINPWRCLLVLFEEKCMKNGLYRFNENVKKCLKFFSYFKHFRKGQNKVG